MVTSSPIKILEFDITQEVYFQAKDEDAKTGTLRGSITNGEGNIAGFVGEIVTAKYLGARRVNQSSPNYDYDITFNEKKIDVKTKRTTEERVLPNYEASIADYNPDQKCDIYLFTRVNLDIDKCWLIGWLPKKQYFKQARFLKKGQIDGSNNFVVQADCYNVRYSNMNSIHTLKKPTGLLKFEKKNSFLKAEESKIQSDIDEKQETLLPYNEEYTKAIDQLKEDKFDKRYTFSIMQIKASPGAALVIEPINQDNPILIRDFYAIIDSSSKVIPINKKAGYFCKNETGKVQFWILIDKIAHEKSLRNASQKQISWQNALIKKIIKEKNMSFAEVREKVTKWNEQFNNRFTQDTSLLSVAHELGVDTAEFAENILRERFMKKK